jgi:hypothetical protein
VGSCPWRPAAGRGLPVRVEVAAHDLAAVVETEQLGVGERRGVDHGVDAVVQQEPLRLAGGVEVAALLGRLQVKPRTNGESSSIVEATMR